eukprot:CAMPEP_0185585602 /NCGR_PEP_ID=MMETSP0434-20130131/39706_1 /TAXON_ID=626734 ORGANISM="Favella taraikaensis, Strain Fe Narragansett Bay" /NCGR_SAMPLE_ID=MMETSP0434 /ASSEMBLY_ACC=CAM_ASM_000379 /LENGTH=178 /DNA_ID=CAMNT_0028206051 /DNA_START=1208 /DNA_END=1744 /DNA_ORIENTATION=+
MQEKTKKASKLFKETLHVKMQYEELIMKLNARPEISIAMKEVLAQNPILEQPKRIETGFSDFPSAMHKSLKSKHQLSSIPSFGRISKIGHAQQDPQRGSLHPKRESKSKKKWLKIEMVRQNLKEKTAGQQLNRQTTQQLRQRRTLGTPSRTRANYNLKPSKSAKRVPVSRLSDLKYLD